MKMKFQYLAFVALLATVASCKKDNYSAPSSTLSGRIVYKGDPIGVENYQVPYQLYQYGFGKVGSIDGSFTQEGNYSSLLFDGDYKLIIPNGQGPFTWKQLASGAPDSIAISLRGSQMLDLEVTPFFMIRNPVIAGSGGKVTATFKAEKIGTKDIEYVAFYINKGQFVSGNGDYNIAQTSIGGGSITDLNAITMTVNVPSMTPTQSYVYGRIGLKIAGVEDLIFSPSVKVTF